MDIVIPISVLFLVAGILATLAIVVKLAFEAISSMMESSNPDKKPRVYMLKVAQDGTVKIRKYSGSVNYLKESSWKDVI